MLHLKLRTFTPIFLLCILAGCGGGGTSANLSDTPNPIVAAQVANITPANTGETVSVFVALDSSDAAAAGASTTQSPEEQRAAQQAYFLKTLEENVTPSLTAAERNNATCSSSSLATRVNEAHTPKSGSAVRIDLNACELGLLSKIKGVAGVYADIPMSTQDSQWSSNVRKENIVATINRSFDGVTAQPTIGTAKTDGTGQVIAIMDTGVEERHPALGSSKVLPGACFSTGNNGGNSLCPNGKSTDTSSATAGRSCADTWKGGRDAGVTAGCSHGTAMAAAASMSYGNPRPISNDIQGAVKGIAPAAKILPVNVFSQNGNGLTSSMGDLLAGVEWVTSEAQRRRNNKLAPIVAMNVSLGSGSYTAACDNDYVGGLFKTAFANLRAQGVLPIVATGNAGLKNAIAFPACVSNAVSVSATKLLHQTGGLASYANISRQTKILAIGGDLLGSYALPALCPSSWLTNPSIGYDCWEKVAGTSPATALVSGGVAALYSAKPTATVAEIETALTSKKASATAVFVTVGSPAVTLPALRLTASAYRLLNAIEPITPGAPAPEPAVEPPPVPLAKICLYSGLNYTNEITCFEKEYGQNGSYTAIPFESKVGSIQITDPNNNNVSLTGKASVEIIAYAIGAGGLLSATVTASTPDATRLTGRDNPIIRIVSIDTR
ncbi:S8 family serine peptidase [Limnohabitans sp.]|uniref:S8 family peptidase n=1 Tax=Limnohabitans sp. TaxID=1907725 RepID=UPI00286F244D|nr:S8 family serine peptidase [Limnohabitans sp.]